MAPELMDRDQVARGEVIDLFSLAVTTLIIAVKDFVFEFTRLLDDKGEVYHDPGYFGVIGYQGGTDVWSKYPNAVSPNLKALIVRMLQYD